MKTVKNILALLTLGVAVTWIGSCKKEKEPTVETIALSDIKGNSAKSGGTVTDDGGSDITARGVCWSTLTGPNINNSLTTNGTGTGSFVSEISGLDIGTKYYLRAYATNEVGTGYGNEIEFTTLSHIEISVGSTTYMMHEDAVVTSDWGPQAETGATSFTDGKSNTDKLAGLSAPSAAKKCSELTTLGFTDWYLPGITEIEEIYAADSLNLPTGRADLWSSTEGSDQSAYYLEFDYPWSFVPIGIEGAKEDSMKGMCVRIKD
ncbi:MAG: hypothetical protein HYZ16_09685 [Bacteroidetes bacterium]|jgi:hypothetical protein|nr:hypothetical protein [Bacteroidota bacterium]